MGQMVKEPGPNQDIIFYRTVTSSSGRRRKSLESVLIGSEFLINIFKVLLNTHQINVIVLKRIKLNNAIPMVSWKYQIVVEEVSGHLLLCQPLIFCMVI